VPTTFAPVADLGLAKEDLDLLFEPHFTIQPDKSHLPENAGDAKPEGGGHLFDHIEEMRKAPPKIAILSGDRKSPYIRIDPYFMDPAADSPRALQAFEALVKALDARIGDLALDAGEICFVDNRKAVHGRRAFKARYDGYDRWFKRMNITRDLRKSREARSEAASRIIQ